jgi:tripartite-type tricarboxylate transporter receptor subunit TctC
MTLVHYKWKFVQALYLGGVALGSLLALTLPVPAQQPGRHITIIVPYSAGNNTPDIVARLVGQELQERLGQPVIVENKPGASGNIGTQIAARAAPDGHTLLMASAAFAQNVSLFKNVPYHPVKDFSPIIQIAEVFIALVVNPAVPATTAREFVEYVKARPGQLNYSSPGRGTPQHLSMELFKVATGTDITHVPYPTLGPAVQDLVAGHVSAMFLPLPVSGPLASEHKIRLLGVANKERIKTVPDVPTLLEQGVGGVEVGIWNGLLAPAGTPPEIIARYNALVNEILRSPRVLEKFAALGINVFGGSPERLGETIVQDMSTWRAVVKAAGIAAE